MRTARRTRVLGVGALALAAAAVGGFVATRSPDGDTGAERPATSTAASPSVKPDGSLVLSGATPTSVATDAPSTVTAPPPSGGPTRSVEVVLAYVEWDGTGVSAAGYVAHTVEQGGTCTLTLSRGGSSVEATGTALPDAATTACGGLAVPREELSPGTWTSVLSYASGTSQGSSETVEVEVP
jgi:hypothetical protein